MVTTSFLFTLALLGVASAQGAYGNQKTSTTAKAAAAAPTMTASSANAVHTIEVGKSGLSFTPNSITANMGDQIEFIFASSGHSVAEGAFSKPCQPSSDSAFYSGFVSPGGEPFTITVNNTEPIWIYCTQVGHCQGGMVGVINPPSSGETVEAFAKAAGSTSKSGSPPHVQGGVFAAAKVSSGSKTSSASSPSPTSQTGGAAMANAGSLQLIGIGMFIVAVALRGI